MCDNARFWSRPRAGQRGEALALACKGKRSRVDAVAKAGGLGAVGEDVAEVAAAACTSDLNAAHSVAQVLVLVDGF